jgi:hypothetical protein
MRVLKLMCREGLLQARDLLFFDSRLSVLVLETRSKLSKGQRLLGPSIISCVAGQGLTHRRVRNQKM